MYKICRSIYFETSKFTKNNCWYKRYISHLIYSCIFLFPKFLITKCLTNPKILVFFLLLLYIFLLMQFLKQLLVYLTYYRLIPNNLWIWNNLLKNIDFYSLAIYLMLILKCLRTSSHFKYFYILYPFCCRFFFPNQLFFSLKL